MKKALFYFIFSVMLLPAGIKLSAQPCRTVIGYYPNWQWYDRAKLVDPFSLKYQDYTIINYAFFKPEVSGLITATDAWADENLLLGQINWSTTPPTYYPNTSLIDRAHSAGVKVLVSIGGWTLSANFPAIAASPARRALFASECNRLVDSFKFDGIDLDWEYPGYAPNGGTPADKANFTLLVKQIRDSLDVMEIRLGKQLLLSSCFGASPANAANIEWSAVIPLLDHINLMTYDYFGSWDCLANHNSPLYAPMQGDSTFNLDSTYIMITTRYQVPPHKVNVGVAFYGRSQMNGTVLHAATNCTANTQIFSDDDGTPLYYNVMNNIYLFNDNWDSTAQVPYLFGKQATAAAGTFVSYDNPASIALKAQYVVDKKAGGVIIWEITGDYMETAPGSGIIAGTPLLDTLNAVFCANPPVGVNDPQTSSPAQFDVEIWPIPATDKLNIKLMNITTGAVTITLSNIKSQRVFTRNAEASDQNAIIELPLPSLKPGIYMLQLNHPKHFSTHKIIIN
jgi:GH18 family chitinase